MIAAHEDRTPAATGDRSTHAASTNAATATAHSASDGRARRSVAPAMVSRLPSTATGTLHLDLLVRTSCHTTDMPCVLMRAAAAVGEALFTVTAPSPMRKNGSPR